MSETEIEPGAFRLGDAHRVLNPKIGLAGHSRRDRERERQRERQRERERGREEERRRGREKTDRELHKKTRNTERKRLWKYS